MRDIDLLSINTIRTLSIDAVQKANSGHPGTPMGMASVAYTVWQDYLRYDPAQPLWPNRDRFILSPGHASMLIYSILHLAKVQAVDENDEVLNRPAVGMDDLKSFRQLGSVTPGHPEYRHTAGVEATTGPLGQGVSMSVGMAIAEKWLAAHYNQPDHTIVDYNIYTLCSDGDMMEGVASEAASLAAHLKLDNLCWIYDSNRVTLDGPSSWTFSENVGARFLAYGWNVLAVRDGNDIAQTKVALDGFLQERSRPTLIVVDTHIGYAPAAGVAKGAYVVADPEDGKKPEVTRHKGWHTGRQARDRIGYQCQHHAAIFDRGVRSRCGGLHFRPRRPDRTRPRSLRGGFRRELLPQPHRFGGRQATRKEHRYR